MLSFLRRHWILSTVFVLLISAIAAAIWIYFGLQRLVRNAYTQWGTADLIINYHKSHGRLPVSWAELEPEFQSGKGMFLEQTTYPDIAQTVSVDFSRLPELQELARTNASATNWPRIIQPNRGTGNWAGAEPNQLIYDYFVELRNPGPPKPQTTPTRGTP